MRTLLTATVTALIIALVATPVLIRLLTRAGIGSQERVDGVATHMQKQGTPTMGGIVIIVASTLAYALGHLGVGGSSMPFSSAGLLVLGVLWALGLVGALDDLISATRRRSLGLSPYAKIGFQLVVSAALALAATRLLGIQPRIAIAGSRFVGPELPEVVFVVWVFVLMFAVCNGVNIASGLDGFGTGSSAFVLFVYVIVAFFSFRNPAIYPPLPQGGFLDTALLATSLLGACAGFLYWHAPPAKIFDGDTGTLALGGAFVALAVVTRTHLMLVVVCALSLVEHASSLVQRYVFKITRRYWPDSNGQGRRVFLMAPLHHHFEMLGWPEITVTIRFWLIAGILAFGGLAMFYAEFLSR